MVMVAPVVSGLNPTLRAEMEDTPELPVRAAVVATYR
jgi:hypothetical protein